MQALLEKLFRRDNTPRTFYYSKGLRIDHQAFDKEISDLFEPYFAHQLVDVEKLKKDYTRSEEKLASIRDTLQNLPEPTLDLLIGSYNSSLDDVPADVYAAAMARIEEVIHLQGRIQTERDVLRLRDSHTAEDIARSYINQHNSELDVETLVAFMNEFPSYDPSKTKQYIQFIRERDTDYFTDDMEVGLKPLLTRLQREPIEAEHERVRAEHDEIKTQLDVYNQPLHIQSRTLADMNIGNAYFTFSFSGYEGHFMTFTGSMKSELRTGGNLLEPLAVHNGAFEKTENGIAYRKHILSQIDIETNDRGYYFTIQTSLPQAPHSHATSHKIRESIELLGVMVEALK